MFITSKHTLKNIVPLIAMHIMSKEYLLSYKQQQEKNFSSGTHLLYALVCCMVSHPFRNETLVSTGSGIVENVDSQLSLGVKERELPHLMSSLSRIANI